MLLPQVLHLRRDWVPLNCSITIKPMTHKIKSLLIVFTEITLEKFDMANENDHWDEDEFGEWVKIERESDVKLEFYGDGEERKKEVTDRRQNGMEKSEAVGAALTDLPVSWLKRGAEVGTLKMSERKGEIVMMIVLSFFKVMWGERIKKDKGKGGRKMSLRSQRMDGWMIRSSFKPESFFSLSFSFIPSFFPTLLFYLFCTPLSLNCSCMM